MVLLPRELHLLFAPFFELPVFAAVQGQMSPSGGFAPGRSLDLKCRPVGLAEFDFEPDGQSIGLLGAGCADFERFPEAVDFLVLDLQGVEVDELGGLADYQARVHYSDHRLVRYPALHGAHLDAVGLVPKFDFLVDKVLVFDKGALVSDAGGQDQPLCLVSHVEVPGLDDPVEEPVVVQVVPHGLADDDIHLVAEILEEPDLDDGLEAILPDDFPHHVHILPLGLAVAIDHAVHLLGAGLGGEDRVQTVAARSDVQHSLIGNVGPVLQDGLHIALAGQRVGEGVL